MMPVYDKGLKCLKKGVESIYLFLEGFNVNWITLCFLSCRQLIKSLCFLKFDFRLSTTWLEDNGHRNINKKCPNYWISVEFSKMHTGVEQMAAKQCRLSDIAEIVNIHNETEICIINTQSESEIISTSCYYDTVYCWFP